MTFSTARTSPVYIPAPAANPGSDLRVVDPGEVKNWNELVRAHPACTFFHTAEWARVLSETYGYKPCYLAYFEDEKVEATLPLIDVKTWLTARRGIGLPFTDACPPLTSQHCGFTTFLGDAISLGKQNEWKFIEIRGEPVTKWNFPKSLVFWSHKLNLEPGAANLLQNLDSSVRRAIRKAERSEITVSRSENESDLREYFRLHCLTRKTHGIPPQPYSFFKAIFQHVIQRGLGTIFLAKTNSKAIAGGVFFNFGSKVIYKFGASDPHYEQYRPNNLWMWRAIQHYAGAGFVELDFGRTSIGSEGLRRYKQNWGTVESQLSYLRIRVKNGAPVLQNENLNGWKTRLFRYCPLGMARIFGAVLYPHVG